MTDPFVAYQLDEALAYRVLHEQQRAADEAGRQTANFGTPDPEVLAAGQRYETLEDLAKIRPLNDEKKQAESRARYLELLRQEGKRA